MTTTQTPAPAADYIIPAAAGFALTATGNPDGGLNVYSAGGMRLVTLRPEYINECGGALNALDYFYRPLNEGDPRDFGPARNA